MEACPSCHGRGLIYNPVWLGDSVCLGCRGTGKVQARPAPAAAAPSHGDLLIPAWQIEMLQRHKQEQEELVTRQQKELLLEKQRRERLAAGLGG
jgi:hypothetical protein